MHACHEKLQLQTHLFTQTTDMESWLEVAPQAQQRLKTTVLTLCTDHPYTGCSCQPQDLPPAPGLLNKWKDRCSYCLCMHEKNLSHFCFFRSDPSFISLPDLNKELLCFCSVYNEHRSLKKSQEVSFSVIETKHWKHLYKRHNIHCRQSSYYRVI